MRIVTRPDFDGIVCAVLLYDALDVTAPVIWVEPSEVQKGLVQIQQGDIIANLPYDQKCALWFDHHYTNQIAGPFEGAFKIAPSAAGIVYEYFKDRFKRDYSELVQATNKIDAADLTLEEVLHPENHPYVFLSLTVSNEDQPNEDYWNRLVALLQKRSIGQILKDPEVRQHCQSVTEQNERYVEFLKANTVLHRHVAVTDFRPFDRPPSGNRFLVYSLFPESFVNVRIRFEDRSKQVVVVNVGHSIFNPKCNVNVGLMLVRFGGGGHRGAGSARFPADQSEAYISSIIDCLVKNENNER